MNDLTWISHKKQSAFSLLEMLLSISLMLLLLLLLTNLSNSTLHCWQHLTTTQKIDCDGNALLQLLHRDLRGALFLQGKSHAAENTFLILPTKEDALATTALFFLTRLPPECREAGDLGDLHAVGYFLSPAQEDHQNTSFDLYRFYASNQETMEALAQGKLQALYQQAISRKKSSCEKIASNIDRFQVTPFWGNARTGHEKKDTPTLLRISFTMGVSPQGRKKQQKKSFTTLITTSLP